MVKLCVFNFVPHGPLNYLTIWKFQKFLLEFIHYKSKFKTLSTSLNDEIDYLILVEHESTYTLGRGSSLKNIKFDIVQNHHSVVRVERGGEVTWHGMGQLVAYPIFQLQNHKRDLHWFTRSLEQTVLDTLETYNINGVRSPINSGVWITLNVNEMKELRKISAVGVSASRWITMHGIAMNVCCDLKAFEKIIPCGIEDPRTGVTSMKEQLCEKDVDIHEVGNKWIKSFQKNFSFTDVIQSENPRKDIEKLMDDHPSVLAKLKNQTELKV